MTLERVCPPGTLARTATRVPDVDAAITTVVVYATVCNAGLLRALITGAFDAAGTK